jgi:hypothetical protein
MKTPETKKKVDKETNPEPGEEAPVAQEEPSVVVA